MALIELSHVKSHSAKANGCPRRHDVSLRRYLRNRRLLWCWEKTLVRLLNGLELPTAGDVVINGQNILALKQRIEKLPQKIGMIFSTLIFMVSNGGGKHRIAIGVGWR